MEKRDVLIIGGSAAGIPAAITARRHYPQAKVTVVRKEQKVLIPCGIPYIFGTVGSPDKNLIPDAVLTDRGIELIIDEVTSIDPKAKTVKTADGRTIGYEKLILATGSMPIVPPLPGHDLENVFSIKKDVDYLNKLLKALDQAKDVVIIGGGFIGIEMADECRKRGLHVSIVELLPHCLFLVFDEDLCVQAENKLRELGIEVYTNDKAKAIEGNGKAEYVVLESGKKLKADVVIFGIGVAPNTKLAQEAGLKIGQMRGIEVDRFMRTSEKDIFAVGDCAEKYSFFTGQPSGLRLASIATAEARIAGANLFELRRENKGVVGVFSTIIRDFALGLAGLREKTATDAGFEVVTGTAKAVNRHPGCMPGATPLEVKLIFRRDNQELIGGQVAGGASVGEMVNILAVMIQRRMRAEDIATFQMGTHPALTASPIAYQIVNAAEAALDKLR
ncbi:MAG: pyridine nucleotide-disulfide oxidoreductase [Chloroflexi bacterium]|nr:MAG: pyridine nucleotide-disulfide oxidoreductase [Chloroflexota bacterium]HDN79278.1 pyridine nucleotide-disulfide oxidoreductase [Chloroflexota bacterium]